MFNASAMFADRSDAGRRLAAALSTVRRERPVVYALPRGGVPVAVEIAAALKAPMDLVLVRKIGAPGEPELALGAIVDGPDPQVIINEDVRASTGADDAYIEKARARELEEIERRRRLYFQDFVRVDPKDRTAIVVDDGLATGATAKAAVRALKRRGAGRVVLAVPVAPPETLAELQREADEVVCLNTPRSFLGVGAFYQDFRQLADQEVVALLHQARAAAAKTPNSS
jgi:predicted phosphoribosyltransferase